MHYELQVTNFTDHLELSKVESSRLRMNIIVGDDTTFESFVAELNKHIDVTDFTDAKRGKVIKRMIERRLWEYLEMNFEQKYIDDNRTAGVLDAAINRFRTYPLSLLEERTQVSPEKSHERTDIHMLGADYGWLGVGFIYRLQIKINFYPFFPVYVFRDIQKMKLIRI